MENGDTMIEKDRYKIISKEKMIIEMKKIVIGELDENINIIKNISKNLSDIIIRASEIIMDVYESEGKVILIGNGGSAADAQHMAAEFVGRFKLERRSLPAIALTTNTSILTALANDYGYENVFSRQLSSFANDKDVLIAITTSGNSSNILKAVEEVKLRNIKVIGMTGRSGGKLKNMVDILINVPSENIPRIQEAHITIGHIICYLVEKNLSDKDNMIVNKTNNFNSIA